MRERSKIYERLISRDKKLKNCRCNYCDKSAVAFTGYGVYKKCIKEKVSIFRIYFASKKTGGHVLSVHATVFERTACQTPRCRNIIYDGVRVWKFHLTTCAHVYHAAGPAERAQWTRMRKQLLHVQSCAPILAVTRSPVRYKADLSQKTASRLPTLGYSCASSIWRLFQRAWLLRSNNSRVNAENISCKC